MNQHHTQPSQAEEILEHLQSGKTITGDQARSLFGCTRLPARINELRDQYPAITKEMIKVKTRRGHTYIAQYSLPDQSPTDS
jgi:uncharacterized coiled-coil DUF342 family protein